MCSTGNVEWLNGEKSRCVVMWRSPRDWGEIVLRWVCIYTQIRIYLRQFSYHRMQAKATGNVNTVLTFYELLEGGTGEGQGEPDGECMHSSVMLQSHTMLLSYFHAMMHCV